MAISSAFKSAAKEKVGQENQFVSGIGNAVTGAASALLSAEVGGKAATAMAGRISGVGGSAMASTMKEKVETGKIQAEKKTVFSGDEIKSTISTTLEGNPINRSALKQLGTVFETLERAKENKTINEKGMLETSFGDVDPTSKLGQQILTKMGGKNDDNDR